MRRFAHLLPALPALALLAGCEAQQEEGAEAIRAAAAVREIPVPTASDEARGIFTEAQHALDMGRTQEAIDHLSVALEIDPQYAEAHNNLGMALAQQGRLDEAIEHFSQALRINPEYENARRNLQEVLEKRKHPDKNPPHQQ